MSKVSLIAKLNAAEGKEADLEAAISALVAVAEIEPGLEVYSAHRSDDEPGIYYFFEVYTDADAYAVHGKSDEMKAAMGAVGAFLAGRPEVTMMTPFAAKGLAL